MGKAERVQLPGERRPFRRAGPGAGSAGSCQSYTMHHGLSTRGWGGRTVTRPASPAAAGPDPGKSRLSSTEVKQEMGRGRLGKQMWQDEKGKTDFLALRLYGVQTHGGAVEGTWVHLAALLGSGRGRCVLGAGPRRVHLKPKVHSSRLFEYSWKELSLVIFIKSLSFRTSVKSLSLALATRGYRTSVRNPLEGVPSKRTICVICF